MRYLLTVVLLSSLFTSSAQEFMGGEIYFDRIDETRADIYVDVYYQANSDFNAPNIELSSYVLTFNVAWYEKKILSKGLILFRYTVEGYFDFSKGLVVINNAFEIEDDIINYGGISSFTLYGHYTNNFLTTVDNPNLPRFNNFQDSYFIQDGILFYLLESEDLDSLDEVTFSFDAQYVSLAESTDPSIDFHFPEATDTLILDTETGLLIWERPLMPGKYFFPLRVTELRYGLLPACEVKRFQIIEITEEDIVTSYQSAPSSITGQIKLYPNPVRELLTIELENIDQVNPLPFRIIDSKGIAIHTGRINVDKMQISTQEWASGMYYLVITTGEKFPVVKKIVVD